MVREFSVWPLAEINAVQNVAGRPVPAAGGVVDMNAENAGEGGIAFHLVGNRARYARRLRLALPRGAVVERTVLDRHPELVGPERERHGRISIARGL